VAGFAGILRLDGAPLDPTIEPVLDAMGRAITHRGLAARRVVRRGPLGLVVPADAPVEPLAFDGRPGHAAELAARFAARGVALLDELTGPFALAIWDEARAQLLLARDRLGVRPLFHAVVGKTLLFGSEVKALLAHPDCPREIDWLAGLVHEAMPRRSHAPTSFVHGIAQIGAGARLIADARHGMLEPRRWYRLAIPSDEEFAADRRSDAEIIDGYRAELARAVDDALGADADRAGLQLSGGIDSVSIAWLAARRARVPTFTVLGQSTFGNGDAGLAHRAATALGLPPHLVLFRVDEPITPDDWRRLLWLTETPFCAFQHYYKFHLHRAAREVRPDLVTFLNGEGSDEFAGADFRNQGEDVPDAGYDDYLTDLAAKQREEWHTVETLGVEAWIGRSVFTREFLAGVSGRAAPRPWHRRIAYSIDGFEQDVLWRDDRLAAGFGMASDAPFLDHRLVEYAARIPPRAHASLFWHEHLLREAMAGVVPEPLRHAPKIPFFGGVDSRFTSRLLYNALMADDRALVREALGDGRNHPVLADGLVDDVLDDLAADPQRGAVHVLLTLVNLGLLGRMARDAAARPGPAAAIPALPALTEWDEPRIAERLAPPRVVVDLDAAPAFAPHIYLVRPDAVGQADPPSYLVVNDQVRFVLDGEETRAWREVLRRIDGKRSLRAILDELGLELGAVRKHLDEALDFQVLVFSR
jgi:asparagine synthase (glutamine-hydrolysing)